MKNFTLGLNIVLAIAVAVLFYLHFSANKKPSAPAALVAASSGGGIRIAYFESDSLQNNFDYYKQVIKELSQSEQQKQGELTAKKNAYLNKVKEYQAKAQTMNQNEMAQAQQDLAQREKDFQMTQQAKGQEMDAESFKKRQDVKKKIEDFLKEYNKNKTYAFILSNSSDLIYYKDSTYDITNDLIKGLNEKYKNKN